MSINIKCPSGYKINRNTNECHPSPKVRGKFNSIDSRDCPEGEWFENHQCGECVMYWNDHDGIDQIMLDNGVIDCDGNCTFCPYVQSSQGHEIGNGVCYGRNIPWEWPDAHWFNDPGQTNYPNFHCESFCYSDGDCPHGDSTCYPLGAYSTHPGCHHGCCDCMDGYGFQCHQIHGPAGYGYGSGTCPPAYPICNSIGCCHSTGPGSGNWSGGNNPCWPWPDCECGPGTGNPQCFEMQHGGNISTGNKNCPAGTTLAADGSCIQG